MKGNITVTMLQIDSIVVPTHQIRKSGKVPHGSQTNVLHWIRPFCGEHIAMVARELTKACLQSI